MGDAADHEKRARELADATRRFLVGLNTGGVGATLALGGSLAGRVGLRWAVLPIGFFTAGLAVTLLSLMLAKHRELKRRDAAAENRDPPTFKAWYWRSFTYEAISTILFALGVLTALAPWVGVNVTG